MPNEFNGVFSLDSGHRFFDIVLNDLGKIKLNSRKTLELLFNLANDAFFVHATRPVAWRLQIHEELRVEEACGIGSVVGPAELRGHRLHRRVGAKDPPHFGRDAGSLLERDVDRHRRAYPEIALLQCRHKLSPHEGKRNECDEKESRRKRDGQTRIGQSPMQHPHVQAL